MPGSLDLGLDVSGVPMHNFVVSTISADKKLEDQDCIDKGILIRQDAIDSALFRDVPGDFVCLNEIVDYSNQTNLFNDTVYGTTNTCVNNPTDYILE